MNTPSHAILNLALLLNVAPQWATPILIGSVLPDAPMFILYAWAKIRRIPEAIVWRETYWKPFWQGFTHGFHSLPLAAIGALVAYLNHWQGVEWMAVSAILHSLGDLPVHRDDAHRHFLPFSHYRFISPVSYWDRRYYGAIVSFVERLLVLMASGYLWLATDDLIGKGALVIVNFLYWSAYLYPLVFRRCESSSHS